MNFNSLVLSLWSIFSLKSPTITAGIVDGNVDRKTSRNANKYSKFRDGDLYIVDKGVFCVTDSI